VDPVGAEEDAGGEVSVVAEGPVDPEDELGAAGAVMATAAEAWGGCARCAARPVTVRLTEVTDEASTGTVSAAWSCRGAAA
jgi:hypothetical protein